MVKYIISVMLTFALIGINAYGHFEIKARHEKIEPAFIENELLVYYIKHTHVRVRHYMLPHTKVEMYCPECGDLQKLGTMDLKTTESLGSE